MAKPQKENGHIDIANELAEALCRINLSAYEFRVLWAIWRRTYGWHKKYDRISYSQFEELTKLKRWHIARTLTRLRGRNLIVVIGNGQNLQYGFQKDYEKWDKPLLPNEATKKEELLPEQVTTIKNKPLPIQEKPLPIQEELLPNEVMKPLPIQVNTKERKKIQKKIQKKEYGTFANVFLTDDEYQKLKSRFKDSLNDKIEELSSAIASRGYEKRYKSHYATILNWAMRADKGGSYENKGRKPRPGAPGYIYTDPDDDSGKHGDNQQNPRPGSPDYRYEDPD